MGEEVNDDVKFEKIDVDQKLKEIDEKLNLPVGCGLDGQENK